MFVELEMKDGSTRIVNINHVVFVERRGSRRLVVLKAHRLARVWRWFRSPLASESIVLDLDDDEARPLIEFIRSDPGY